jgi:hypothetical protein
MEKKHLNVGVYETTETFKAIEKHSCVCFDDMTLVAVTGPAEDKESQEYAELFAAAPELLEACEAAFSWLDNFGADSPIEFGGEQELHDILHAAIAKAKGAQS